MEQVVDIRRCIRGATLTSFMVAAVLSAIVGIAVMRLATTQGKAMVVISLLEEREQLLKNYANILVSGWDRTRDVTKPETTRPPYAANTPLKVYNRDGTLAIKSNGTTTPTGKPWWTISAFATSISDSSVRVKVVITFDGSKHFANLGKAIADREEWVYLHSPNITASQSPSINTDCSTGSHPSQTGYSGEGALVRYDFNTNYTECSSVPLIQDKTCSHPTGSKPIIGFNRDGFPVCSSNHVSVTTGHCLGSGQFLLRIKADGTVACNDTRSRVAIVNRKSRRQACPFMVPFSDTESHVFALTWRHPLTNRLGDPRGPAGDSRYPRSGLYEAGGIRGIGNNGQILPCVRMTPTSKGDPGMVGADGVRGPKGPRGVACVNRQPPIVCKGEKGDDGQELKGPKGPVGTVTGPKGYCKPLVDCCRNDSGCRESRTYCSGGSWEDRERTEMRDCYDEDGNKLPDDCPYTWTERVCTGTEVNQVRDGTCNRYGNCEMNDWP